MEQAFGADFSGVRVHAGPRAADLNDRIQAKAFTTGNNIFFRDGLPDANTHDGQSLLAHELTHTIQQGGGVQRAGATTPPRTPEEEAAAKAAFVDHYVTIFDDVTWMDTPSGWKTVAGVAGNVWEKMKDTLSATAPLMDAVPKDAAGYGIVTARDGNAQIVGTDPQYRAALDAASEFAAMLRALTKQSKKSREIASLGFAFWSGEPAKKAAQDSGLQSLEGSQLGGEFEGGIALPEGTDMSIWGSVSQAYAEWAVEVVRGKTYKGFVGKGGDRDENIYNSVERWAFQKGAEGKFVGIDFNLSWHPVIPGKDAYQDQARTKAPYLERDNFVKGESEVGKKSGYNSRGEAVKAMLEADKERTKWADETSG